MARIDLRLDKIDHYDAGVEKTLQQFKFAPNYLGFLKTYLDAVTELEDVSVEIMTERTILTANGQVLDWFGFLFGLERPAGMTDDRYREVIFALSFANASTGTPSSIQQVVRNMSGATNSRIFENTHRDLKNKDIPSTPSDPALEPTGTYRSNGIMFAVAGNAKFAQRLIQPVLDYIKPAGSIAVYYDMGATMRWRGYDIVPIKDPWVTADGVDNISEFTGGVYNNLVFNANASALGSSRPSEFNEIPSFLGYQIQFVLDDTQWVGDSQSISSFASNDEGISLNAITASSQVTNSGWEEDVQNDKRGVFCEIYTVLPSEPTT